MKDKPDFDVGDTVECEGEEYTIEKVYIDVDGSGWVVDYTNRHKKTRYNFPSTWFKKVGKKVIPKTGQTAKEIEQGNWDKCPKCNRTMEFITLGYNCPTHGPKE